MLWTLDRESSGSKCTLREKSSNTFRDPPSMFETMAVQNLRKPADWLFKVMCWHGVILNLAQNGLWPVATNNFEEEPIVASYWPKTSGCLVCPYLYLCIWGSCLYLCICL